MSSLESVEDSYFSGKVEESRLIDSFASSALISSGDFKISSSLQVIDTWAVLDKMSSFFFLLFWVFKVHTEYLYNFCIIFTYFL